MKLQTRHSSVNTEERSDLVLSIKPDLQELDGVYEEVFFFLGTLGLTADNVGVYTMIVCGLVEKGITHGIRDAPENVILASVRVMNDTIFAMVKNTIDVQPPALYWIRGLQDLSRGRIIPGYNLVSYT